MRGIICLVLAAYSLNAWAQSDSEIKINLNESGSHFIKTTVAAQIWMRYNESNPGTTVNGFSKNETFDIGVRRARFQLFGKIHDKVFVYTQFGVNNFGYNTERRPGIFFHDVMAEYHVTQRALHIGAGLTAWNGFARYASASVVSSLSLDVPIYQQTTIEANDQFYRKLSVYAKGKLGKVDYRLVLTNPMLVGSAIPTVHPISVNADFSYTPPKLQTSGYVKYQFFEEESNLTPYHTGTYLGKKRVFNLGAGFQFQPEAMWRYGDAVVKDTVYEKMLHYAVDVFYDCPIGAKGAALTAYGAISHTDYGKNYLRNLGPMNPGSGGSSLNGGGTAYPVFGTGNTAFVQVGYLLPNETIGRAGRLQPYGDITYAQFDRLNQPMVVWGLGANWLIDYQRAKISLGYQNRPIFDPVSLNQSERRSMLVLQFQVAI
jgi:hypothetical protein